MQKQMEVQHDAAVKRIEAFRAEMRSGFAALAPIISLQFYDSTRLSERLAVVEKKA